jgi:hypothetical protein
MHGSPCVIPPGARKFDLAFADPDQARVVGRGTAAWPGRNLGTTGDAGNSQFQFRSPRRQCVGCPGHRPLWPWEAADLDPDRLGHRPRRPHPVRGPARCPPPDPRQRPRRRSTPDFLAELPDLAIQITNDVRPEPKPSSKLRAVISNGDLDAYWAFHV